MSDDTYTDHQRDCLESLQDAADLIGESPTIREYRNLDLTPSADVIKEAFGTWNRAKEAIGLAPRSIEGHSRTDINETYFETIDTDEKAYWLGCLFCYSSLNDNGDQGMAMQLGRSIENRYYIEAFADAVDSKYAINEFGSGDSEQISTSISNRAFLDILADHGLTESAKYVDEYPDIPDDHEHAFMRAILENIGNVAPGSGGWTIRGRHESQLERVKTWIDSTGVKQSTLSTKNNGTPVVYVSNVFDAATVFEAAWPNGFDTTPTNLEVAQTYAQRIADEHPYPENLSFTPVDKTADTDTEDTKSDTEESQSSQNAAESMGPTTVSESIEQPESADSNRELVVPLSLDIALLIDTLAATREQDLSAIVVDALQIYLGDLLAGDAAELDAHGAAGEVVDRSVTIPAELMPIIETASEHVPLRKVIESAVQHAYGAESDTVSIEVPTTAVDEVPTNTVPIVKSLGGFLPEE